MSLNFHKNGDFNNFTKKLQMIHMAASLAPPLRRAGGGAEESGDTAIQSVAERNAIIGS